MKIDTLDRRLFAKAKKIVILPHTTPDGDTLGSSVALVHGLATLGHDCLIVLDDEVPDEVAFIVRDQLTKVSTYRAMSFDPDLAICVDMSDIDRLADRAELIDDLTVVNIDHHKSNTQFGLHHLIDTTAAATGEIIYQLLKELKITLTKTMARALYVAILTDSGDFKYSSTTSDTLRIAADLIDSGFDREEVMLHLYHSKSPEKVALHAACLKNTKFYCGGRRALCTVSQALIAQTHSKMEDVDGLVESIRDIKGVQFVALLKERGRDQIKVSLRSLGDIDVAKIALQQGGGGHNNAAGFTLEMPLERAISFIETHYLSGE